MKLKTTFDYEKILWGKGFSYVAGLDEVGRGAFAGPVVVAAVIFSKNIIFHDNDLYKVTDSKLLTPQKRKLLAEKIKNIALCYAVAEVSVGVINEVGIGKATQQGFQKATRMLSTHPDFLLIDAFYVEGVDRKIQMPIIHGDVLSYSIAAASILAKVYRDEYMESLDDGKYLFAKHKGYGTLYHRQKIKEHGLSSHHRTSFSLEKYL
ncbi:MAG: ribonuclease HII [Candidatus Levybacteria bacterium]|nr:ribonuclease HII [Candidatus Levybacteria bacterium]